MQDRVKNDFRVLVRDPEAIHGLLEKGFSHCESYYADPKNIQNFLPPVTEFQIGKVQLERGLFSEMKVIAGINFPKPNGYYFIAQAQYRSEQDHPWSDSSAQEVETSIAKLVSNTHHQILVDRAQHFLTIDDQAQQMRYLAVLGPVSEREMWKAQLEMVDQTLRREEMPTYRGDLEKSLDFLIQNPTPLPGSAILFAGLFGPNAGLTTPHEFPIINKGLGKFKDDIELARQFIEVLVNSAADAKRQKQAGLLEINADDPFGLADFNYDLNIKEGL